MEGHGSHIFGGVSQAYTGPYGSVEWYRDYLAVTGACMMMNKKVFQKVGGFDESYLLVFSDIEICLRAHPAGVQGRLRSFCPAYSLRRSDTIERYSSL